MYICKLQFNQTDHFILQQQLLKVILKHCQRHNGPEDWVLLTKVTYFSHIIRSNTKFDQISSSKYWPSTNFKISTTANISISTSQVPPPTPRRWVGGPMSRKRGKETVSISASFRCSGSLMGECDTNLELCLSKDSICTPQERARTWNMCFQ